MNKGKIINRSKSSYGPYKLSTPRYPDVIENIIYNKSSMLTNINKKKKELSKLIAKKTTILKKLETKVFEKQVLDKISLKFRISKDIIRTTLKEELGTYKKEIDNLDEEKKDLDTITFDNFFKKLNKAQKEKMININPTIDLIENGDEETDIDSIEEKINRVLEKPKNRIRKDIQLLIDEKIKKIGKKKKKIFRIIEKVE